MPPVALRSYPSCSELLLARFLALARGRRLLALRQLPDWPHHRAPSGWVLARLLAIDLHPWLRLGTPAPRGEFVKLVECARWLVRVGTVAVQVAQEAKRGDPRCTVLGVTSNRLRDLSHLALDHAPKKIRLFLHTEQGVAKQAQVLGPGPPLPPLDRWPGRHFRSQATAEAPSRPIWHAALALGARSGVG